MDSGTAPPHHLPPCPPHLPTPFCPDPAACITCPTPTADPLTPPSTTWLLQTWAQTTPPHHHLRTDGQGPCQPQTPPRHVPCMDPDPGTGQGLAFPAPQAEKGLPSIGPTLRQWLDRDPSVAGAPGTHLPAQDLPQPSLCLPNLPLNLLPAHPFPTGDGDGTGQQRHYWLPAAWFPVPPPHPTTPSHGPTWLGGGTPAVPVGWEEGRRAGFYHLPHAFITPTPACPTPATLLSFFPTCMPACVHACVFCLLTYLPPLCHGLLAPLPTFLPFP